LHHGSPSELRQARQETYVMEAADADLRHHLRRVARKSRCFSRRLNSLIQISRLFLYCYKQFAKRQFPHYSFDLVDFVALGV
jgi:hypothetical protein